MVVTVDVLIVLEFVADWAENVLLLLFGGLLAVDGGASGGTILL